MCQFILGRKQDSIKNWEVFEAGFYYSESSLCLPHLAIMPNQLYLMLGFIFPEFLPRSWLALSWRMWPKENTNNVISSMILRSHSWPVRVWNQSFNGSFYEFAKFYKCLFSSLVFNELFSKLNYLSDVLDTPTLLNVLICREFLIAKFGVHWPSMGGGF